MGGYFTCPLVLRDFSAPGSVWRREVQNAGKVRGECKDQTAKMLTRQTSLQMDPFTHRLWQPQIQKEEGC